MTRILNSERGRIQFIHSFIIFIESPEIEFEKNKSPFGGCFRHSSVAVNLMFHEVWLHSFCLEPCRVI